jgi:hypothetical protein
MWCSQQASGPAGQSCEALGRATGRGRDVVAGRIERLTAVIPVRGPHLEVQVVARTRTGAADLPDLLTGRHALA